MKKPSTFLRSLSSCLSTRLAPSPAVTPWPLVRSAYDRWLAVELDELHADPLALFTSAAWLGRALGLAAQRRLVASANAMPAAGSGIDRKTMDECVEDTAELLDACAGIRDRLDMLKNYVSSTRIALHWLEGHGGAAAQRHAAAAFAEIAKCGSNLRKLGERALHTKQRSGSAAHSEEPLFGARAAALLAVGSLGGGLLGGHWRRLPRAAAQSYPIAGSAPAYISFITS